MGILLPVALFVSILLLFAGTFIFVSEGGITMGKNKITKRVKVGLILFDVGAALAVLWVLAYVLYAL